LLHAVSLRLECTHEKRQFVDFITQVQTKIVLARPSLIPQRRRTRFPDRNQIGIGHERNPTSDFEKYPCAWAATSAKTRQPPE
jgi:hypothetical protein